MPAVRKQLDKDRTGGTMELRSICTGYTLIAASRVHSGDERSFHRFPLISILVFSWALRIKTDVLFRLLGN